MAHDFFLYASSGEREREREKEKKKEKKNVDNFQQGGA